MSSPLAIGAVSAVLRNLLDDALIEAGAAMASSVQVSAVAPDTIDLTNPQEPPRLNLFLHRVTPNAGWSNSGLPSRGNISGSRLTNAPLALDLHYLVTAYARGDCQAEILLGYAMHLLHERPVLDRAAIRTALDPSPLDVSMLPPAFQALVAADLADQVELIRITPVTMSGDEMSKLWSAIASHYRPSAAYQISVVLIENARPAAAPLPVLSRGLRDPVTHRDRGVIVNPDLLSPLPSLFAAETAAPGIGARLDEEVVLRGVRLGGTGHVVRLSHRLFAQPFEVVPSAVDTRGTAVTFRLPDDLAAQTALAAGQLAATVRFVPEGAVEPRETNGVSLVLAPIPVVSADVALGLPDATAVRGGAPVRLTVTLAARPQVRLEQKATLMLDTTEATALPRAVPSDPLRFEFPATVAAGPHWLRLRVDGVDSVLLDRGAAAPAFDLAQRLTVPA